MERRGGPPLHRQLADLLQREIAQGRLRPGQALPAETELGQRYGLSRATVRQALSGLERAGLIRREMGRGTFVTGQHLQLESRMGPCVGMVMPSLSGMFRGKLLEGLQAAAAAAGYGVLLEASGPEPLGEERAVGRVRARGAVGVLVETVGAAAARPGFYDTLRADGFPAVFVDRRLPGQAVPWVGSDNRGGGLALARHLLRLGHRRLCFVVPHDHPTEPVLERERGLRQALREEGLEGGLEGGLDEARALRVLRFGDAAHHAGRCQAVLESLLAGEPAARPTALLCANDHIAMELLAAVRGRGLRVPGDIALTGFDDLPYAPFLDPPLTTVRQFPAEMGRQALGVLRHLADGRPVGQETVLAVALQVRASTVGEAGATPEPARAQGDGQA